MPLLRYSLRLLARAPLFTLTAVVSLAIGLGANIAIFSAANALLLAPTAAVHDVDRIVDIGRTMEGRGFDTVSYLTFADLRDRVTAFEGVYAVRLEPQAMSLVADDGAHRVYAEQVSASYFDVLGLVPAAGTFFHTSEEQIGVPLRTVVISHRFWMRQFDGRDTVVGEEVVLNGDRFTILGIAPEGYQGTTVLAPDLWVPLTAHARALPAAETLLGRQNAWLVMGARLRPGVSIAQAQQALDAFMRGLVEQYPDVYRRWGLIAMPASRIPGDARALAVTFLGALMGLVGLVLLVACTNLAGLMLSRAANRSREVAVRLALGASRTAIVRLLLTETMVVFALGAASGWLVSLGMSRLLASTLTALPFPVAVDFSTDWRVLLFAVTLTLLTGVLTGLAPALQSARASLVGSMRTDARATPRRQRLRRGFIAAQLAFCLVLVIAAGLFVRALAAATAVDPGFAVDGIEVATIDLALGGYEEERAAEAAADIQARLAALPGVDAVGLAARVPLSGGGLGLGGLRPAGAIDPDDRIDADWNVVSPEFLPTLSLPLVRGRQFRAADRAGAPDVAIVNERLASGAWPGQDPIGQILENGDFRPGRESSIRRLTVIGVARDVKYRWLGDEPRSFIYVPFAQHPMRSVNYILRASEPVAATLAPAIRGVLKTIDPNLPLIHASPLRTYADLGLLPQRVAASLAGALGLVALLLAAIGVYGVTAYAVASRRRDIGVRLALGADTRRVVRDVTMEGARLTAIGGGIGLAAALAVTHLLAGLLFGVSPVDPATFAVTAAGLGAIGVAASYLPARRAAKVDPIAALRSE